MEFNLKESNRSYVDKLFAKGKTLTEVKKAFSSGGVVCNAEDLKVYFNHLKSLEKS